MSLSGSAFRDVMGRLAGGVAVVSALDTEARPRGLTATAICSVSLEPPLVLVCVGREAHTLAAIRASGRYALNFLRSGDRSLAERFAASDGPKFEGVEWAQAPGGCPVLRQSLAWVECQVDEEVEAGDHSILIGLVTTARVECEAGSPLVHFVGRYHTVSEIDE